MDDYYVWLYQLSILDYLIWKGESVHNGSFSLFITTSYLFYPLMGYFIDQRMSERFLTWKLFFVLTIVSIIAIVICCYMTVYRCEIIGEWVEASCQYFFTTLIFIPTITFFIGAKLLFTKYTPKETTCAIISKLGGATFGIYLIENILRQITYPVFVFLKPYIRTLPACWVWILVACIVGTIVSLILKRIPIIKHYI